MSLSSGTGCSMNFSAFSEYFLNECCGRRSVLNTTCHSRMHRKKRRTALDFGAVIFTYMMAVGGASSSGDPALRRGMKIK